MELKSKKDLIQNYCNRGQNYCHRVERVNSTPLKQTSLKQNKETDKQTNKK